MNKAGGFQEKFIPVKKQDDIIILLSGNSLFLEAQFYKS
jgi:hypothetical protein